MRVKDEFIGKEVIDADVNIVGDVSDVIFDVDTYEISDIIIKKSGFSNQLKDSENVVPVELIKVIGDKIFLKGIDDL